MKLHPTQILIRPLITEKTNLAREERNEYVFEVHKQANKRQVADAVTQLFGVNVQKVRTLVQRGKFRRVGQHAGYRANFKKAFVTLADGDSIDFFEGV